MTPKYKLTDMHGCRGVIVEVKEPRRVKGFTFAELFKLWPTRN
jgi:hypothetical protein